MALVKICGITRVADARAAIDLGADLLGLNFWPGSSRCLGVEEARRIARAVAGRVPLVGVFVNAPPEEVRRIEAAVGLDLLQFHGDEGPEEVRRWGNRGIRVLRLEAPPEPRQLEEARGAWGLLLEIRHSAYGGAGKSWDYSLLAGIERVRKDQPLLVAGGIRPDNVRQALQQSGADGVDVCSGVESAPGIKDRKLLERLITEVHNGESLIA